MNTSSTARHTASCSPKVLSPSLPPAANADHQAASAARGSGRKNSTRDAPQVIEGGWLEVRGQRVAHEHLDLGQALRGGGLRSGGTSRGDTSTPSPGRNTNGPGCGQQERALSAAKIGDPLTGCGCQGVNQATGDRGEELDTHSVVAVGKVIEQPRIADARVDCNCRDLGRGHDPLWAALGGPGQGNGLWSGARLDWSRGGIPQDGSTDHLHDRHGRTGLTVLHISHQRDAYR